MPVGLLPRWLKAWLICSTVICSMDVAFTVLRPESLRNGTYGKYFFLWHIYADVDSRYGDATDPFTRVTGTLMCVELVLNVIALFMDFFRSSHALLAAFTSSVMVFWKTTIYLCLYIITTLSVNGNGNHLYSSTANGEVIVPNTPIWKQILVFWMPNCIWVFIPLLAICQLWRIIARGWKEPSSDNELSICGMENLKALTRKNSSKGSRQSKSANRRAELCALDELDPEEQDHYYSSVAGNRKRRPNKNLMERLKMFNMRKAKVEK